ncbi:hypothetical protein [Bradyrhizobium erythrophlei]|uniref:Uncharacterized protein n=1 Tax=Bradyrhizobium erythrophlei TaxID=1437360 RepID=A0A1M5RGQ6_9BRAD|nr:hypothetical protein [Bradyrhizobium erythrophlei]SHH25485.1 hypothetical protein SAMN05444169_6560 [Bradyrhizobium erythrophlei]
MATATEALPGSIFLLGDSLRGCLAMASKSDNLQEVRELLEKAHGTLSLIIQEATNAQSEIDGGKEYDHDA